MQNIPDSRFKRMRKFGKTELFEVHIERAVITQSENSVHSALFSYMRACTLGQPNFFLENWDKFHGEVWAKYCLDTSFQPIRKSFDHDTEAQKVPTSIELSSDKSCVSNM